MPRRLMPDLWLFGVALVLVSIGVVMVYSASAILAAERFSDPYFFLKRQLFWAVLGMACLWGAFAVDYRALQRLGMPLLIVAGVLLVLVLIPPFGQPINGTRRWLRFGAISFQPVELAKLVLVIYLAAHLARMSEGIRTFWQGVVPPALIAGVFAALSLRQPDLGNSLALLCLSFTLLFLAGARPLHLGLLAAPALPLLAVAIYVAPYRWRRILAFLDPEADPLGSGFQIIQSYLAIGAGGWQGRGLGESRQKLFYLPEPHTDFIFAVIGEELGLVGALAVIALFVLLIWRGLRVGLRAPDAFGAYLALGLTVMLATQTLVNLGVVTGTLPTKGLPLPFISFGGSALLTTMIATGVLLNISQHSVPPRGGRV
jgi:cell division protein FtsW